MNSKKYLLVSTLINIQPLKNGLLTKVMSLDHMIQEWFFREYSSCGLHGSSLTEVVLQFSTQELMDQLKSSLSIFQLQQLVVLSQSQLNLELLALTLRLINQILLLCVTGYYVVLYQSPVVAINLNLGPELFVVQLVPPSTQLVAGSWNITKLMILLKPFLYILEEVCGGLQLQEFFLMLMELFITLTRQASNSQVSNFQELSASFYGYPFALSYSLEH